MILKAHCIITHMKTKAQQKSEDNKMNNESYILLIVSGGMMM